MAIDGLGSSRHSTGFATETLEMCTHTQQRAQATHGRLSWQTCSAGAGHQGRCWLHLVHLAANEFREREQWALMRLAPNGQVPASQWATSSAPDSFPAPRL